MQRASRVGGSCEHPLQRLERSVRRMLDCDRAMADLREPLHDRVAARRVIEHPLAEAEEALAALREMVARGYHPMA